MSDFYMKVIVNVQGTRENNSSYLVFELTRVNCISFKSPIDILVHGPVMNFQEEKMDLSLSCLILEPIDWYSKDQSTNKTLLAQINSKAKLQTETYESYF